MFVVWLHEEGLDGEGAYYEGIWKWGGGKEIVKEGDLETKDNI